MRPYGGSSVVSARLRACEQAPRLASPNPSPARSLGRSRRPRNWDTEALPVCPSHRDAYAPSSQAQPVSVDTTTSRPVARAPALPPAPRRTCADRVCASGGSAASRPHARTAEPRARKPPREGCGARAVSTSSPDSEVVLGDPGLRPSPPYPQKVPPPARLTPMAKGNTHIIRGTCWTQCLLPSRGAGRERGEGREQCVADSHVRLARWLPVGRVGRTRREKSGAHSRSPLRRVPPRPAPLPSPRAAPTSLMWGPRRSSAGRSGGDTPNPKVNEEGKKKGLRNEVKTKTPNCPRSFFFGLNINGRCPCFFVFCFLKKFLCIQKFLKSRKLV